LSGAVLAAPQFAGSLEPLRRAPRPNPNAAKPAEAVALHGQMNLLAPRQVTAGSNAELRFEYTCGEGGVDPGGIVRIALRHVCPWTEPQTDDPSGAGYVRVWSSNGATLSTVGWPRVPDRKVHLLKAFPWQHTIDVRVDGPLSSGDTLTVIYGDRAGGGPGVRVQTFAEEPFRFRFSLDRRGDGTFVPVSGDSSLAIVAAEPVALAAIAPADVAERDSLWLLVRAEDRFGNLATSYSGSLDVRVDTDSGNVVQRVDMPTSGGGLVRITDLDVPIPGIHTFHASDGRFTAESNPFRVHATTPPDSQRVYWGELHGHTLTSDGRGTVERYFEYAEEVAGLQVCAVTDHDFMMSDLQWSESKRITNERNRPGRFVTLQAYEWSGLTEVGGDHNVYFRGWDSPLIRCRTFYDYDNPYAHHLPFAGANHIEDLYNALLADFEPDDVLVVPQYGGRPAAPRWHRPEIERLIEIFSEHQRSEDWATDFAVRGYRLGVLGAGDDHIGRPGYGFLPYGADALDTVSPGKGLVAILATELTRDAVFDALVARRVYATTGQRILLDVRVNGEPMGSEVSLSISPTLAITATGTSDLAAVQVLRNDHLVEELVPPGGGVFDEQRYLELYPDVAGAVSRGVMPSGHFHYMRNGWREGRSRPTVWPEHPTRTLSVDWSDQPVATGDTVAYAVRVVQRDGGVARSSPVWVTGHL
jgi:hypothetical protein